jgi:hypothetical protein
MTGRFDKGISKYVIEIRFKPDPRFLDKRGEIAAKLTGPRALFQGWRISPNRIDFTTPRDQNLTAFFSFSNLGLVSASPNKVENFTKSAENWLRATWSEFLHKADLTRIGIRSIFFIETDSFEKCYDAYRERFLKLSDEELDRFGGELIEIGFPLNFRKGEDYFNLVTGPMRDIQAKLPQFLGRTDLPAVGIYLDVDFYRKDLPRMELKDVLELLNIGVDKAEEIASLIVDLITKGDVDYGNT